MTNLIRASPDSLRRLAEAAIEQAKRAFPNVSVELKSDQIRRSLFSRQVEKYAISHLWTPETTVEASGPRATQAGLGGCLKLIWQFKGTLRYEDAHRSFILRPGEALITAMACTYYLEMSYDYEGLVLIFDPASNRSWQDTVYKEMGKPLTTSGPLAAAAAGTAALLQHRSSSPSDELALESMVDIALRSLGAQDVSSMTARPLPAILLRARLLILQHISDQDYDPDRLARDLGLSRRSLYNAFDQIGLTPGHLIRNERLERAHRELLGNPNLSITAIALRNGFSDSSGFSHTFRANYGISPRDLRNLRKLP
ncbi:helix-turn-helix domain-containing protein [Bradyrhizobium sp. Ai1a-2]|uniref:helix-turn-helix domain-containing protein n=1 Tax=Bradyrhizobium sp. Ai1a-2 TaxID=196490 RepID=UPI0004879D8E|nr:helix-turn-helix domain-containing protein [Bradyrhizobium sp. Ai1a-2]